MLCLVTGLSGVGVSTVLESFKEDFTVLNFADIVMKISDIHSRGFIDCLSNYQLREVSYNVIKYINDLDKIVENAFTTMGGLFKVDPTKLTKLDVLEILKESM